MESHDKRIQKGEQTLKNIISSALELISEGGISNLSASKLSELANVSKSTVFHHFKSAEDIPVAVLHSMLSEMLSPIETAKTENLYEFLNYLGQTFVYASNAYKNLYKAFFSFYHESLFHNIYQDIIKDYLKKTKQGLTEQIQYLSKRSITEYEARLYATLIISSLDGLGLHMLINACTNEKEYLDAWEIQVKCICNTINQ